MNLVIFLLRLLSLFSCFCSADHNDGLPEQEFQRYDGWYNNWHHNYGVVGSPLIFGAPPAYADGVYKAAGEGRPPAGVVSSKLLARADALPLRRNLTALFAFFGEAVSGEILSTVSSGAIACPPEPLPQRIGDFGDCNRSADDGLLRCADEHTLFRVPFDPDTGWHPNNPRRPGSSLTSSRVMNGMVFKRGAEGEIRSIKDAKIAVFTCAFDITQTETKGTVLINTAKELMDFSKDEEAQIEAQVAAVAAAGVNVVVSGGKFGDLPLHFLNQHGIMAVRLNSKFDVRRLCRAVGAIAYTRITAPAAEAIGRCTAVEPDEVGDTEVTVFGQASERGNIATVLVRGSSDNLMDDIERAVNDAVNTFEALTKDDGLVPGAGAVEEELARQVESYGERCAGLEQYAIKKFALALEALPKQLADNAGVKSIIINEFVPLFVGRPLAPYTGYRANVDPALTRGSVIAAVCFLLSVAFGLFSSSLFAKKWMHVATHGLRL